MTNSTYATCGACYSTNIVAKDIQLPVDVPARITPPDWLKLVITDVLDADHAQRWSRLSAEHPEFMRELMQRAFHEAPEDPEVQKKIIDTGAWVLDVAEGGRTILINEPAGSPPAA